MRPSIVRSPVNAHLRGPGNEAYINLMRTMTPTGRDFLSVEEMTGAAVFLASDDASAIHGATLMVDAGWSAI
jgi:NAD(P)-dependent dehydrogenase (short-subunit alcohol dehydrogenase family)